MNGKDAVALRVQELCAQRGIAVNALANQCGVPPTTIYSILSAKRDTHYPKALRRAGHLPAGVL